MATVLTTGANQLVFQYRDKWYYTRLANEHTPEKGKPFLVYKADGDLIQFDGNKLTHLRWR